MLSPLKLPQIMERGLRYLMVAALPIAVGVFVLADKLVVLLFKSDFTPAVPVLQIIIWTVPLMYASELLGYVVLISNRESRAARSVVVSTLFNVGFNLLLVPRFGFMAAAVMTVVTEAVLVGQHAWTLRSMMRQVNLVTSLLRPLAAAGVMGLLTWWLRAQVPLLANVALSAGAYALLLVLLRAIGSDELRAMRSLRAEREHPVAP
jgi:O-antigen/teichoic acid export membrane protein